jgi:hypothetical protein
LIVRLGSKSVGVRTRGFVEYRLPEAARHEPERILRILSQSTRTCREVEHYWRTHDPSHTPELVPTWSMSVFRNDVDDLSRWWFHGPGSMKVRFGPQVAQIFAGARWRGFLSIPALREVHHAAFRSIARSLIAKRILFVPDFAEQLDEAVYDGASFDACLRLMEATWGPAQGSLCDISPQVVAQCEHGQPEGWYLEPV